MQGDSATSIQWSGTHAMCPGSFDGARASYKYLVHKFILSMMKISVWIDQLKN